LATGHVTEGAIMKTNAQLETDVRAELDFDPEIPAAEEIAVAVQGGHVTLRGTAPNFHQRRAAVKAAKRVEGTFDVDDQVKVRLMDELARRDADLRGAALQALQWNVRVPASRIDVAVDGGHVTLTGHRTSSTRRMPPRRPSRRCRA
jgi:osmotically-inducible protein OsmY